MTVLYSLLGLALLIWVIGSAVHARHEPPGGGLPDEPED